RPLAAPRSSFYTPRRPPRPTPVPYTTLFRPPRAAAAGAAGGGVGAPGEAVPEKSRHIRVDLRRLDELMDLIGELVTARGRLNELAAERRDPAIDDVAIQISRLFGDLQGGIIQARMTPVWQVFDRFPRLVRDLARRSEERRVGKGG